MIKNRSVIWWLLLCCAVVCSAVLLFGRISVEESGHDICAAMQLDDLEQLAEKTGPPVSEGQARLDKVGVRYSYDDTARATALFCPRALMSTPTTAQW